MRADLEDPHPALPRTILAALHIEDHPDFRSRGEFNVPTIEQEVHLVAGFLSGAAVADAGDHPLRDIESSGYPRWNPGILVHMAGAGNDQHAPAGMVVEVIGNAFGHGFVPEQLGLDKAGQLLPAESLAIMAGKGQGQAFAVAGDIQVAFGRDLRSLFLIQPLQAALLESLIDDVLVDIQADQGDAMKFGVADDLPVEPIVIAPDREVS